MNKFPMTQKMIDEAKTAELVRASYDVKAEWHQYSQAKTPAGRAIDCELHLVGIFDDEARAAGRITKHRVTLTQFFCGCERISRARAESLLTPQSQPPA